MRKTKTQYIQQCVFILTHTYSDEHFNLMHILRTATNTHRLISYITSKWYCHNDNIKSTAQTQTQHYNWRRNIVPHKHERILLSFFFSVFFSFFLSSHNLPLRLFFLLMSNWEKIGSHAADRGYCANFKWEIMEDETVFFWRKIELDLATKIPAYVKNGF